MPIYSSGATITFVRYLLIAEQHELKRPPHEKGRPAYPNRQVLVYSVTIATLEKNEMKKNGRHNLSFGLAITFSLALLQACGQSETGHEAVSTDPDLSDVASQLVDARRSVQQTDVLARSYPDLDRDTAIAIQLAMLDIEQNDGATLIGWKMGGTGTSDPEKFDPTFGYMLDSNVVKPGGTFSLSRAPLASMKVEAEVGFVLARDLVDGVETIDELKESVAYVVGAIEIVQPIAVGVDGNAAALNDIVATGVANLAVIEGTVRIPLAEFDAASEFAYCEVNGEVVAEGGATRIYGGPLNALFELANLLPKHGAHLKAGQLVISGSMYPNPVVDSEADVKVVFSTLGEIEFSVISRPTN